MPKLNIERWTAVAIVTGALGAAYGCSGSSSSGGLGSGGASAGATAAGAAGKGGAVSSGGTSSGGTSSGGTSSGAGASSKGGAAGKGGAAAGGEAGALAGGEAGAESGGEAGAESGGSAGSGVAGTGGASGSSGAVGTGGSGGQAQTCFVPYGCSAYVCNTVSGSAGAGGDDDGAVVVTGATPAVGPRGGLSGSADASGLGAGEAYVFGSSDDLVGADANLPLGASVRTLSLWMQSASEPGAQTLFNYGSFVTDERFGLLSDSDSDYFVGEDNDLGGTQNVDDGNWHHIVAVYDGTNMGLYVDGRPDTSGALIGALNTVSTAFAIGHTVNTPGRETFQGKISDIRVYNRVLSDTEIGSLATFTGTGANPEALRSSTSGLVFWLPLISSPDVMRNRCAP